MTITPLEGVVRLLVGLVAGFSERPHLLKCVHLTCFTVSKLFHCFSMAEKYSGKSLESKEMMFPFVFL
jgi:hypothetical protein